ncbi:hypothetical protein BsWGS_10288 [Bradybaena similaris]
MVKISLPFFTLTTWITMVKTNLSFFTVTAQITVVKITVFTSTTQITVVKTTLHFSSRIELVKITVSLHFKSPDHHGEDYCLSLLQQPRSLWSPSAARSNW